MNNMSGVIFWYSSFQRDLARTCAAERVDLKFFRRFVFLFSTLFLRLRSAFFTFVPVVLARFWLLICAVVLLVATVRCCYVFFTAAVFARSGWLVACWLLLLVLVYFKFLESNNTKTSGSFIILLATTDVPTDVEPGTLLGYWNASIASLGSLGMHLVAATSAPWICPVLLAAVTLTCASIFTMAAVSDYKAHGLLNSPSPLYGETVGYGSIPYNPFAFEKIRNVQDRMSDLRAGLVDSLAGGDTTPVWFESNASVFTATTATQSSFDVLVAVFGVVVLVAVFVVFLLLAVGTRMKYVSLRTATGLYECGADDAANRLSIWNKVQFFRVVVLFLVFEVEIAVLLMVMPVLSLIDAESIVVITVFMLLIQLGAIMEIRAGAISWWKSASMLAFTNPTSENGVLLYVVVFLLALVLIYAEFCVEYRFAWSWCLPVATLLIEFLFVQLAASAIAEHQYLFFSSEWDVEKQLIFETLEIINSAEWHSATSVKQRLFMWRAIVMDIMQAEMLHRVGFWASYVEFAFTARTMAQLDNITTLLRYNIAAVPALSNPDFVNEIEIRNALCFKYAPNSQYSDRATFEKCIRLSMDRVYMQLRDEVGQPKISPDAAVRGDSLVSLKRWSEDKFKDCIEAGGAPARSRLCRHAVAGVTEVLFTEDCSVKK